MKEKLDKTSKRIWGVFLVICFCIGIGMTFGYNEKNTGENKENRLPEYTQDTSYVTAAHYFADEWPINFWNAEWDNLENDLEQIKSDGFNTVIFVVPWREFQPDIERMTYNDKALERLDYLLAKVDKAGLWAKVRLGYLNDYYGEGDTAARFYAIVGSKKVQKAWFEYAQTIYSVCIDHECFKGGFITWEDFWHNYALIDYVGGTELGIEMASDAGFQDYVENIYGIEQFNVLFKQNFGSCKDIYVPQREHLYAGEWYSYIDQFTLNLLKESRKYFPGLSMEVRTDTDNVATLNGKKADHIITWDCAGGRYTAIMYKPDQGIVNGGSQLSSKEAVKYLEMWLKNILSNNSQTPIFMEQFLFADNTPGFENTNKIKENQLNDYLLSVDKVLYENTMGYGVWVYKDYKTNMIYNPQFALGLDGWSGENVEIVEVNGSAKARLHGGSFLSQNVPSIRRFSEGGAPLLEMDVINISKTPVTLKVEIGEQNYELEIEEDKNYSISLPEQIFGNLKIYSQGEILIDNIRYYTHRQRGYLYDCNGKEDMCIWAIRELNRKLFEWSYST